MDEIRQKAAERRATLIDDAQAFLRAVEFLRHARASKKRAGGPELTWREAEGALKDRAATLVRIYNRAVAGFASGVAA
jgi:hypothetical protein